MAMKLVAIATCLCVAAINMETRADVRSCDETWLEVNNGVEVMEHDTKPTDKYIQTASMDGAVFIRGCKR